MTEPNAELPTDGATKPDPSEGLRLMKAFLNIAAHDARASVIKLAEQLAARRAANSNEPTGPASEIAP